MEDEHRGDEENDRAGDFSGREHQVGVQDEQGKESDEHIVSRLSSQE